MAEGNGTAAAGIRRLGSDQEEERLEVLLFAATHVILLGGSLSESITTGEKEGEAGTVFGIPSSCAMPLLSNMMVLMAGVGSLDLRSSSKVETRTSFWTMGSELVTRLMPSVVFTENGLSEVSCLFSVGCRGIHMYTELSRQTLEMMAGEACMLAIGLFIGPGCGIEQ
ncbi:hypothetical protein NE237_028887 [Protea cynaroides]|uniref:Uncharacterized protein n=1 Tax=Protea cynaroides TaxID=273540 RepID=A0A9Q0JVK5_9MAGN|nr:hypothetical protein NE237_028887 [Protea cynaroides]